MPAKRNNKQKMILLFVRGTICSIIAFLYFIGLILIIIRKEFDIWEYPTQHFLSFCLTFTILSFYLLHEAIYLKKVISSNEKREKEEPLNRTSLRWDK